MAAPFSDEVNDVLEYLRTGGFGEVVGLTEMSRQMGEEKVQMDTSMAMALLYLADRGMEKINEEMKADWPFPAFGQAKQ